MALCLTPKHLEQLKPPTTALLWTLLKLDIHAEEAAIELFAENILNAGHHFLDNPMETPFTPSWNGVDSALPDLPQQLIKAVDLDMHQYSE